MAKKLAIVPTSTKGKSKKSVRKLLISARIPKKPSPIKKRAGIFNLSLEKRVL
jgi:hypothetical protein